MGLVSLGWISDLWCHSIELMDEDPKPTIKARYRILLAFGIPVIGMLCVKPPPWSGVLILLYPLGFSAYMGMEDPTWWAYSGYMVLLGLMLATMLVTKKVPFMAICGALIVACTFTTAGCRMMFNELEKTFDDVEVTEENPTESSSE